MKHIILITLLFTFSSCTDQNKCDNLPELIVEYFPDNFFLSTPEINNVKGNKLTFKLIIDQSSWHQVYHESIATRIHHLLDSIDCYNIQDRLANSGVQYFVYNKVVSEETEGSFIVSGTTSLSHWQFPRFRELNDILINSDPLQFNAYDQMLSNYHLVFEDSKYDITFSDLYDGIVQNRMLMNDDFEILDSLIQNAKMNSAVVDTNLIKEIRRLTPAVGYGFQEDLKIIDLPVDEK